MGKVDHNRMGAAHPYAENLHSMNAIDNETTEGGAMNLERTGPEGGRLLELAAIRCFKNMVKGQCKPMSAIVWRKRNGNGRLYRVTRRSGSTLWMRDSSLGAYSPRGMSQRFNVGPFLREYIPVRLTPASAA